MIYNESQWGTIRPTSKAPRITNTLVPSGDEEASTSHLRPVPEVEDEGRGSYASRHLHPKAPQEPLTSVTRFRPARGRFLQTREPGRLGEVVYVGARTAPQPLAQAPLEPISGDAFDPYGEDLRPDETQEQALDAERAPAEALMQQEPSEAAETQSILAAAGVPKWAAFAAAGLALWILGGSR